MSRSLLFVALLAVVSACGHRSQAEEPRPQTNVLTREEMAGISLPTAYDAVERLRPRFLRPRATGGGPATAYPVVYIDGVRRGTLEVLRSVATSSVLEIRYLSAADATTRYGLDVQGGVLDVKLSGR